VSDLISMDKEYKTRCGETVKILTTSRVGDYPVIALIGEEERIETFSKTGQCCIGVIDNDDLFEVKPRIKQEAWMNIYQGGYLPKPHSSKEKADKNASITRIACVKVEIDCEHGEGL